MLRQVLVFLLLPFLFAGCLKTEEPPLLLTFEEQLALDKTIIQTYLTENSIDAEYDDRGFWYVVHEEGDEEGKSPVLSNIVRVTYEGRFFSDDQVFDGGTTSFQLTGVIIGWQYGLQLMKEGASYTFYFPSGLCYGRSGRESIPPDANLIFDVELLLVI